MPLIITIARYLPSSYILSPLTLGHFQIHVGEYFNNNNEQKDKNVLCTSPNFFIFSQGFQNEPEKKEKKKKLIKVNSCQIFDVWHIPNQNY